MSVENSNMGEQECSKLQAPSPPSKIADVTTKAVQGTLNALLAYAFIGCYFPASPSSGRLKPEKTVSHEPNLHLRRVVTSSAHKQHRSASARTS